MNLHQRDGGSIVFENADFSDVIKYELRKHLTTEDKLEALSLMFANLLERASLKLSTNEKLEIISYEWEEQ